MSAYNFGVRGCSSTKLWPLVVVLTHVQLLRAPLPTLKFKTTKTFKNRCDIRQLLSLSANISETDEHIDKIYTALTKTIFYALNKKNICEIPSTTNKVISVYFD